MQNGLCIRTVCEKESQSRAELLKSICDKHGVDKNEIKNRVKRVEVLDNIPEKSIDLVLSHSVLEHVANPEELLEKIGGKLSIQNKMIHIVAYHDHFFKYPYHILMFSKRTWQKWLNPGDLPGWRLYDHLKLFE